MRIVSLRHGLIFLVSISLTACMLGPDFHSPKAPLTNTYTANPQPVKTVSTPKAGKGGVAQHIVMGEDIPAQWWTLFHSKELTQLINIGINNSPNLDAAKATLREAEETLNAEYGSTLLPQLTTQFTGERELFNTSTFGTAIGTSGSSIFNLYGATANISYTLDVFGANRREIESLAAQVDYQTYELSAAYLTLTSNIVTTAVNIAQYRAQIEATQQLIKAEEKSYEITKKQYGYGGVAGLSVLSQLDQLALTRASLPAIQQNLSKSEHALSVLIGELPSDDHLPKFDLNKLVLPSRLPTSLPSRLVRQRPDVLASEALLHAACAQVGVATANLFPQISISAAYGWQSLVPSGLFRNHNLEWNWGGSLLQPIFEGGSLLAKRRGAIDAYLVAQAQYRQTVLQAFQNVADTLRALQNDAQALKDYKEAEVSTRDTLRITQQQYFQGGVSYLNLITAEGQYQQAVISRVQAQAARYNDTAGLFQALGGGWWNLPSVRQPT
jgi:NodT family efflux transporter outer membrane factor (OMF) lipoprotein